MSKTEIVTELQTILNDLKGITADLEQNISGLKDFLEDRKFIPKETWCVHKRTAGSDRCETDRNCIKV